MRRSRDDYARWRSLHQNCAATGKVGGNYQLGLLFTFWLFHDQQQCVSNSKYRRNQVTIEPFRKGLGLPQVPRRLPTGNIDWQGIILNEKGVKLIKPTGSPLGPGPTKMKVSITLNGLIPALTTVVHKLKGSQRISEFAHERSRIFSQGELRQRRMEVSRWSRKCSKAARVELLTWGRYSTARHTGNKMESHKIRNISAHLKIKWTIYQWDAIMWLL